MEWWLVLPLIFAGMVLLMATGIPVALSFFVLIITGLFIVGGTPALTLLPGSIFSSTSFFALVAIPMFFLLGEVLYHSGVFSMVMDTTDKWVGRFRARLLLVSLGSGTMLAALSGAGIADTALLGSTIYPEAEKRGYDRRLLLGTIASSGLLAILIPPSALAVLVASLVGVSVGQMLMAGLLPGLLMATIYLVYILVRVRLNPNLAPLYPTEDISLSDKVMSTVQLLPLGLIIFAIIGFILLGVATPTEAAATGAVSAVIVTALYRRLNFGVLRRAVLGVVNTTGMILLIVAGAKGFSQLVAMTGAMDGMLEAVIALPVPPMVILIVIMLALIVLGLFVDSIAIILIAIPILNPMVQAFGWDPIWFWILALVNMLIGTESPPFGLALFALKGVVPKHVQMKDIYLSQLPFVALDIGFVFILMAFPSIVTWLPDQIFSA